MDSIIKRARNRGFSLIELLVVIAIIGIVMSIAMLSLGLLGDDRQLQTEGRRMIALVQVAQDEATMQGREFGMEITADAYRFVEYDPYLNTWGELIGDDTLRLRQLPEDLEFDLYIEGQRVLLDLEPASFDTTDETTAADLGERYAPHVFIFSSGDMTPFELHILRARDNQAVAIESNLLGEVKFAEAEE
jgi:general secretion pathway protein H